MSQNVARNMGQSMLWGGSGLLLGMAIWAALTVFSDSRLVLQFTPQASLIALWRMLGQADIWWHMAMSLQRIGVGLLCSLVLGYALGICLGVSGRAHALLTPLFQFLRMISPLSWMPIAVMAFGIGDAPIYFLLTFAGVWPILLNTSAGVRGLRRGWLLLGRSLAATRLETFVHIIAPGSLASVLTGCRLAIGVLWIVLVPCEMLGVSAGLGYLVLDTRDRMAYSELMAVILLIGLLGYLLDSAIRYLFTLLVHQD